MSRSHYLCFVLLKTGLFALAFAFVVVVAYAPSVRAQDETVNESTPWQAKEGPAYDALGQRRLTRERSGARPYPRPDMRRSRWMNLNGLWEYAFAESAEADVPLGQPQPLGGQILVPFAVGVGALRS